MAFEATKGILKPNDLWVNANRVEFSSIPITGDEKASKVYSKTPRHKADAAIQKPVGRFFTFSKYHQGLTHEGKTPMAIQAIKDDLDFDVPSFMESEPELYELGLVDAIQLMSDERVDADVPRLAQLSGKRIRGKPKPYTGPVTIE